MTQWEPVAAGDVVRALRRAAGLSQRELAARARIPPATVGRIEASATADPRLSTLLKVVQAADHGLFVSSISGVPLKIRPDPRDALAAYRDKAWRRLPAHLPVYAVVHELDGWWGWRRIGWSVDEPSVPPFTFARRRIVLPPFQYGVSDLADVT